MNAKSCCHAQYTVDRCLVSLSDTDLALVLCKPFIVWHIEDVMMKNMVLLVHKFASLCVGSGLAPLYARYQKSTRQPALERQDLSCTYLAHHELESVMILVICQESKPPKIVATCIVAGFSMCICLPSRWDLAAVMAREPA